MTKIVAILCADLHLSHTAPLARSSEPDWYAAMARALEELADLADEHSVPVICAGDVFDRWNAPPELINFVLSHPLFTELKVYAIPGQHDLPHHRLEDIKRSAYWTLVEAGVIEDLPTPPEFMSEYPKLCLWPFPWGKEIVPLKEPHPDFMHIAVVHQYAWTRDCCYPGAPLPAEIGLLKEELESYDVAVFGDNHKGFAAKVGDCDVFNCGTFMRRSSDEEDYRPQVGLLRDDGTIKLYYLDTSEDAFEATEKAAVADDELDIAEFVKGLNELGGGDSLDFETTVERYIAGNDVPQVVRGIVQRILEG